MCACPNSVKGVSWQGVGSCIGGGSTLESRVCAASVGVERGVVGCIEGHV